MKKITSLLLVLISVNLSYSQLTWTYTNTGITHNFLLQGTIPVTIDGVQVSAGDYIGVFYNVNGGGMACGGYAQWTGSQILLLTSGAQSGLNNGFANNEPIKWKIWKTSTGQEFNGHANYITTMVNQGNFAPGGYSGLTSLLAISPLQINASISNANCFGSNTGAINLTAVGGIPPYIYQWSTGATTNQISGLAAGFYSITVEDSQNNNVIDSFYINQPNELNFQFISTPVSCYGENDGSITLTLSGGVPPYNHTWSNGETSTVINGLTAGLYSVFVIDAINCMGLSGASVTQPSEINVQTTLNNPTGIGLSDGSAWLAVSGGIPPYSYLWSNASTNSYHDSLGAGTYFVMISDAANCTKWIDFEISDPPLMVYGCMDPLALNYNALANISNNGCIYYDNPPAWTYDSTGVSHTIQLPLSNQIVINGMAIEPGDYIGVFHVSMGILACGGYIQWLNTNQSITAWGDDTIAAGINGFAQGDMFVWEIWDASDNIAYQAAAFYDLNCSTSGLFAPNGTSCIDSLSTLPIEIQGITLQGGWNIISTYLIPNYPMVDSVFSPVVNNLYIMKNNNGQVYWPQYNLNVIGNLMLGQGYQVKMNNLDTLSIFGSYFNPENIPIILPAGWSIIGYLRKTQAPADTMLSTLNPKIWIVKDNTGNVYWPQYGLNTIGNLLPGQGYQLNLIEPDTLTYPAN